MGFHIQVTICLLPLESHPTVVSFVKGFKYVEYISGVFIYPTWTVYIFSNQDNLEQRFTTKLSLVT